MSKVLTILNIGQKIFYQVFDNEKVIGGLEQRIIENNSAVTVAEMIKDDRLSTVKEVGVILINIDKKLDPILKRAFKEASKFNVIQEFDNYQETIKGNDLTNYGTWCIIDSLTENVEVYGLDEPSKSLLLNKLEAERQFFDEVIKDVFLIKKPQIGKTEQEQLLKEWKVDLDSSNEVDRSFTIGGEDKRVIFNNENYVNWTFGSFLNDINKNFSSKQNFYLFGNFLNNKFLKSELKRNGQNTINYKSEAAAAKFIINGAVQLCENEADIEIKEIKSQDDPSKSYSKAELKELYESKNIKYFIAGVKELKDLYGFVTNEEVTENEEIVKKEITDVIGEQLEINKKTKSELIKNAKAKGVNMAFVETEIKKILVSNNEKYEEARTAKRKEILAKINTYVKNKKITAPSEKVEKAIFKKVSFIDTKGFNINKEQIIKEQLSDFEIFFTNYRNKPDTITEKSLPSGVPTVEAGKALVINNTTTGTSIPWGIIASVLLVLVVGFGVMPFMPEGDDGRGKEITQQQEKKENNEKKYVEEKLDDEVENVEDKNETPNNVPKQLEELVDNDYSKDTDLIKKAFQTIPNRTVDSSIAEYIAKKTVKDLENWRINSNSTIDGIALPEEYNINDFTEMLIGDRVGDKTINYLNVDNIRSSDKLIEITLKMSIL